VFDLIFVSLFVAGWLLCGTVPWLVVSVATRGGAGLGGLPLAWFVAIVAGLAVPVLGLRDGTGLVISFTLALAAPSLLLAVHRFSVQARPALPVQEREEVAGK
jgi:hypothetical protein